MDNIIANMYSTHVPFSLSLFLSLPSFFLNLKHNYLCISLYLPLNLFISTIVSFQLGRVVHRIFQTWRFIGNTLLIYEFRNYKIEKFKHIFWGIISVLSFDEFQIYPEKNGLKPVLLLHSPFLLPSFFRREEKKGKK